MLPLHVTLLRLKPILWATRFGYPSVDLPQAVVALSAFAGNGRPSPAATESPRAAYIPLVVGGSAGGSDVVDEVVCTVAGGSAG